MNNNTSAGPWRLEVNKIEKSEWWKKAKDNGESKVNNREEARQNLKAPSLESLLNLKRGREPKLQHQQSILNFQNALNSAPNTFRLHTLGFRHHSGTRACVTGGLTCSPVLFPMTEKREPNQHIHQNSNKRRGKK